VAGLAGPVFSSSGLIKIGLIGALTLFGIGVELETLIGLTGGTLLGVGVAGAAAKGTVNAGLRVGAVEIGDRSIAGVAHTSSVVLALQTTLRKDTHRTDVRVGQVMEVVFFLCTGFTFGEGLAEGAAFHGAFWAGSVGL